MLPKRSHETPRTVGSLRGVAMSDAESTEGSEDEYAEQARGDRGAYERYLAGMDASMQQKVALTAAHLLCLGRVADMGMGSGAGSKSLAALYPEDVITAAHIEHELDDAPATMPAAPAGGGSETLQEAVERHLSDYFAEFGASLPPPGLYHRIMRDVEYPLVSAALAATRGNQIKAAELLGVNRNTLRKKIRDLDVRMMRGVR